MLRQASSRNHRSKGFKLKKFLQIFLLLLVSVWLLYQVKHSYDKKKEFDDGGSHMLNNDDDSQHKTFKFGRKDLPLMVEPEDSTLDTRTEDEENEEFPELEQEKQHEEDADDEMTGGDDAIDEQDREDNVEDDVENTEGDSEMTEKHGDELRPFEEDEENTEQVNEAREKSFQGDNVASAVVHNTPSFRDDNASIAVVHEIEVDHDPSSSLVHDTQVTESISMNATVRNLDEDHPKTAKEDALDAESATNGTMEGADEHKAFPNENLSYNSTSNASTKPTELKTNSTTASNDQMELLTSLTDTGASKEAVNPKNDPSSFGSAHLQDGSAELNKDSSMSSTVVDGVDREKGDASIDLSASSNIENKAMSLEKAVSE